MSIPTSVQKILEEQSLSFDVALDVQVASIGQVEEPEALGSDKLARLVVLQDSIGPVQVLVPGDHLIDLTHLCERLGRNLHAAPPEKVEALIKPLKVERLPDIPQMTGLETIVEKSLLDREELFFHSGQDSAFIRLNHEQLQRLVKGNRIVRFTSPIDAILEEMRQETMARDEDDITRAVEKFTSLRIKQRLVNTLEIPPMPETAERIIKLRVDPEAGIGDLAKVVETDPSLAAQVVSWAASPFYAAPGKITSVHDAVVRVLGFDLVINLALGLALGRTLDIPDDDPCGTTPYWQQAVYCATTMEKLVNAMPHKERPYIGMAYLSGLLNNFGYLVLGHVFPPHFSLLCRYLECNRHLDHSIVEHHLIGVTREQISSWLMSAWNMPDEIVTALRWQREPNYAGPLHFYPNLLYLANQMLHRYDVGDSQLGAVADPIWERLNLTPHEADKAVRKVIDKRDHILTMANNLAKGG